MPIVPPQYGKQEMHPIVLMEETPVSVIIGAAKSGVCKPVRGVEFARFGNQLVVVNHRSSPVDIREVARTGEIAQVPCGAGLLAAHSATCLTLSASA